ncbi:glycosyltransferase family 4 protein [Neomicrococcus lactis]|uniref:glycosyltransferase family 4 protein n=1 Tax=Neomicrococcus lactis TaxID=732241 RepID=UPI0022FFE92C|nr:glycosyltransferase family 4 protein [Neomicrococcus lactis]
MKKPKVIAKGIVREARKHFPKPTDKLVRTSKEVLKRSQETAALWSAPVPHDSGKESSKSQEKERVQRHIPLDLFGSTYTDEERSTILLTEHAYLLEAHLETLREQESERWETVFAEAERLRETPQAALVGGIDGISDATIEDEQKLTPQELTTLYLGRRDSKRDGARRLLVVSPSYPAPGNEYGGGFLHRRIKHYQKSGVAVDMLKLSRNEMRGFYSFDGVNVLVSNGLEGSLLVEQGEYDAVAVHFPSAFEWTWLRKHAKDNRFFFFIHGFEARRWVREIHNLTSFSAANASILATFDRQRFWRDVLAEPYGPEKFIFVSEHARANTLEDMHVQMPNARSAVISNVIDTDLFTFQEKPAEQRFKVLWVRSAGNMNYGADLAVKTVQLLQKREIFKDLEFRIIGDGRLFGQFKEALGGLDNVQIEQRFATQEEIAVLHKDYGIFLVPSRLDTQGVSRDEAMASGLVPVTNRVSAIPEFVDDSCAIMADPEDAQGLADGIERLASDAALFQQMSKAAAARVRSQTAPEHTIAKELSVMNLVDQEVTRS